MKGQLFISGLIVGMISSFSLGAAIFSDDFESGNMDKWTTTGSSPFSISTEQNAVPVGGMYSAKLDSSADRIHHNIIADNGGVELDGPSTFTLWVYDGGASRAFGEVRGYSAGTGLPNGGTTANGALSQLLAIGKYNSVTMPGEVFEGTKYQARVVGGTSNGWFNLNAPGAPSRSAGWHRFDIERLADGTTLNFYVDTILSRTITGATAASWDTVVLGLGAGTTAGDSWIDGVGVTNSLIPEPMTMSLFALGGLFLSRRRSRAH